MRLLIVTAAIAAFSFPALAQPSRPQQPPQQRPAPQQPQAQPQQQDPAPVAGMFACRTENEICYVAIPLGANEVSVLYTNDPNAENIEAQPTRVQGADLSQHSGKVVMLIGRYSAQGLTEVQVVDVAGPLLSFAIKSMLSAGEEEEPEPEPPAPPPQQQRRQTPQQPQQRR
ncbi:MAG TPA: hypothetical protein VHG27_01840 [Xanthobacteraceae bacterium]|nr:hypothetical protein [Xanthobacteraceae bacterium]